MNKEQKASIIRMRSDGMTFSEIANQLQLSINLEKKLIHNDDQLPKYYAEGTHDAIVDEELFAKAQDILCYLAKRRGTLKKPKYR